MHWMHPCQLIIRFFFFSEIPIFLYARATCFNLPSHPRTMVWMQPCQLTKTLEGFQFEFRCRGLQSTDPHTNVSFIQGCGSGSGWSDLDPVFRCRTCNRLIRILMCLLSRVVGPDPVGRIWIRYSDAGPAID